MTEIKTTSFFKLLNSILIFSLFISCSLKEKETNLDFTDKQKKHAEWIELSEKSDENFACKFSQPRAVGFNSGKLYVIDRSGKIKVFTDKGKFLFDFPLLDFDKGTPTGLGFDKDGNILVPDTHYQRILIFSPEGKLIKQFGKIGGGEGEFLYPTDIVADSDGNMYITDYGDRDRISKYDKDGNFIKHWGVRGDKPGEMYRPMSIEINSKNEIVVADSCNHRIQCFTLEGEFIRMFGSLGANEGEMKYPYDICLDDEDNIYAIEFGNCRISKFSREGKFLGLCYSPGVEQFQFHSPWGIDISPDNRLVIADTLNHRVILTDRF